MNISKRFAVLFALLLLASQAALAQTQLTDLTVSAYIDGGDQLFITPTTIHWHHLTYAAVGRWQGLSQPFATGLLMNSRGPDRQVINWFPDWPCGVCWFQQVDSSTLVLGIPLPAQYQLTTMKQIHARSPVVVDQYPSADNGYTTIVEYFDAQADPDWYAVQFTFTAD